MVPAAAMGLDCAQLLAAARTMAQCCGADVPPAQNPGVVLGTALGVLARQGRDKVTILGSPAMAPIGAWLEQLIAESTGKNGKGVVPVDAEPLGPSAAYGRDRLFVYLRLDGETDRQQDAAIMALEQSGQPVIRITLSDRYQIAQEFFRWEMATAVAGAIIGVNPFDQPDVEASKVETRDLMAAFEREGRLPSETPLFEDTGIKVFADAANAKAVKQVAGPPSLVKALAAHFERLKEGDYCALLAYIAETDPHKEALAEIRRILRDTKHVATSVGFGPRFLHSTGQLYKGGPNSGVFLQITCDPALVLEVPGRRYDFGAAIEAQARGDFAVLSQRGRRCLRLHLGAHVDAGLAQLKDAITHALT
jgi:transaldolase / glucose-6-phosphate isomerase